MIEGPGGRSGPSGVVGGPPMALDGGDRGDRRASGAARGRRESRLGAPGDAPGTGRGLGAVPVVVVRVRTRLGRLGGALGRFVSVIGRPRRLGATAGIVARRRRGAR